MSTPTLTRTAPVEKFATVWESSMSQHVTAADAYMARQWGFSDWQWASLTDSERADFRSRIVYAPGFSAEGK